MSSEKNNIPNREVVNTRASGTYGGEGTMDGAVIRLGEILLEDPSPSKDAKINAILESEVRCHKCSARFKLVTGWVKDTDMAVKVACPYCNCDVGFRYE